MAIKAEPAIAKAEEILEYLGSLDEVCRYYEAREMAIRDEITRITGAREEGKIEGGISKVQEIAKKLVTMGLDIKQIIEATGLSEQQIKEMQNYDK